jgi:GMP synthase-like glutamine amidotransferase
VTDWTCRKSSRCIKISFMNKDVEHLAYNEKCAVQGMYKGKIITVQGHPEFTEEIVRELLEARRDLGVLNDEMYNGG